jgi:hypothetical protein
MSKIKMEAIKVTPKIATEWLEKNTNNRSIRDYHVEALARDMREGRWKINGDTIRFDAEGNLADGQHRLWAILNSGTTQQMFVVRGISVDAFDTIDSGALRTAGDALHRSGFTNTNHLAAATRVLNWYDHGHLREEWSRWRRMTHSEIINYVKTTPGVHDAVRRVKNSQQLNRMSVGAALPAIAFLGNQVAPELTERFLLGVETGEGLSGGDPRLTLRDWYFNHQRGSTRIEAPVQFALGVKAFNAFAEAKPLRVLKMLDNETVPDVIKKSKIKRGVGA